MSNIKNIINININDINGGSNNIQYIKKIHNIY